MPIHVSRPQVVVVLGKGDVITGIGGVKTGGGYYAFMPSSRGHEPGVIIPEGDADYFTIDTADVVLHFPSVEDVDRAIRTLTKLREFMDDAKKQERDDDQP